MNRPKRQAQNLEGDAKRTLSLLSEALGDVIASLPIAGGRPRDIEHGLGLNRTLAWKICKIASGGDLFGASSYVPGRAGMEKFLQAAEKRGGARDAVARARVAVSEYERLVETHTGDRATLESALTSLAKGTERPVNVRSLRRDAFRAYVQFMGMQQRAHVLTLVLGPSATPGRSSLLFIRGFIGMRVLRHGADLPIASRTAFSDTGEPLSLPQPQPIRHDDAIRISGAMIPLLRECCTSPLPEFQTRETHAGLTEVLLKPGPLGINGESTLFLADLHRDASHLTRTATDGHERVALSVRAPIERVVVDMLVYRPNYSDPSIRVREFVASEAQERWNLQPTHTMAITSQPETLETHHSAMGAVAHASLGPEYERAVQISFAQVGWALEDFRLYRVISDFPLLRSAIGIEMTLPS